MKSSISSTNTERALAAIVLTDAVSFSARMSVDEEGTLALIQRDLKLIANLCDRFGGNVLKSTGDGLLMSFYSAVQAVLCSQEIQKELARLTDGLPPEEYLLHRIGIHLGDVLFSHEDVLGNGVNIAARLQTQSVPGGICISQTLYDVVKAGVDLNAIFLGPLKLKNIQEPVSAYQIPPVGQSATMAVSRSPRPESVAEKTGLALAAQTLERNPYCRRIKKLVFGTYQGVWENDPRILAQFELLSMLETLCQRHSTLIALEKALQATASTLNHKDEYLEVTATILSVLETIYEHADNTAGQGRDMTEAVKVRGQYHELACILNHQEDRLRIKKLLYAMLHSIWENDPATLALQTMEDLIADVHQLAPTETDLSYHLERIVKRLNRQTRYMQIAHLISETLHSLYRTAEDVGGVPMVTTPLEAFQMDQSATELSASEEGMNSATRLENPSGGVSAPSDQTVVKAIGKPTISSSSLPEPKTRDRANLHNLRMEIMRYTNPLRAKILLLSTVRSPFSATPQDWLTLKSKTLNDLILETFTYCSTFADLESKLTIMCHCVEGVPDNLQAASAILKAMKPYYP